MKLSRIIFSLSFIVTFCFINAQNDTLWFDYQWNQCSKRHASFYRPDAKKVGDKFLIKDYYVDGSLQMEGYSYTNEEPFELEGDVIWYHDTGETSEITTYSKNQAQLTTSYHENGAIEAITKYKNGLLSSYTEYDYEVDYYSETFNLTRNEPYYHVDLNDVVVNGKIYEIDFMSGDTLYSGYFDNGEMQYFSYYDTYNKYNLNDSEGLDSEKARIIAKKNNISKSELKDFLYPTTKKTGKLVDGIEIWQQYVGDVLCAEQSFKNGMPYGDWKEYDVFSGKLTAIIPYGDYGSSYDIHFPYYTLGATFPPYYYYTGGTIVDYLLHGEYQNFQDGELIVKGNYWEGKPKGEWYFKYEFDKEYFTPETKTSIGSYIFDYTQYYDNRFFEYEDYIDIYEDDYYDIIEVPDVEIPEAEYIDKDNIFIVVEEMPIFNYDKCKNMGKSEQQECSKTQINQYIAQIEYPPMAKDNDIEGKVYVKFIINKKGTVEDVEIVKGADQILNEAAIDHIKAMPKWKAGVQRGEAVKVQYLIPITFKLLTDEEPVIEEIED